MMKRITSIILVIFFIYGLSCFSLVSADVTSANSLLIADSPDTFYAYGFEYIDNGEIPPFHKLQNLIEFEFTAGTEVNGQFTVEYTSDSIYGPAVHVLDMYLVYDKAAMESGLYSAFISGYFTYDWEHNGDLTEYTGTIVGGLREIETGTLGFYADYDYTNALALELLVDGDPWDWTIYLEVPGEEYYYSGTGYNEDEYINHNEEAPHVPSPEKQADVAAGVGISTVGIALANALTKTSIFGSASFNAAVSPTVPAPAAPTVQTVSTEPSKGFFGNIWNFFRNLFNNVKDMLTDEGRSYASGKLSDLLDDTDIDNTSDDN